LSIVILFYLFIIVIVILLKNPIYYIMIHYNRFWEVINSKTKKNKNQCSS